MDNCLSIPELVFEICSHCRSTELTTLGRTARLFDCVLDVLWSDLACDEAIHLFSCFSSEVVTASAELFSGIPIAQQLSLSNPLEPRHWERFKFYAKRVRSLTMSLSLLDSALLGAINLRAPFVGGVLPNLRELIFDGGMTDPLHLRLFPGPKLDTLSFNLGKIESDRLSLLACTITTLPTLCPGLTSLSVGLFRPVSDIISIEALLAQLSNLRILYLNRIFAVDLALTPSLSTSLSKLNELFLSFKEDDLPPIPSGTTPVFGGSLRWLHLEGSTEQIIRVLSCISQNLIEYLCLECTSGATADVRSIICQIASLCARDALQYLILDIPQLNSNDAISCGHFSPLFAFPNMAVFECPSLAELNPDDCFTSTLTRSWPKLVTLDVGLEVSLPSINAQN